KPGPAGLITLLWALKNDGKDSSGFGDVVHALAAGRTSVVIDPAFDKAFYKLAGFRNLGRRAVRVDILERLADLIRPALAWKAGVGSRPDGAYDGGAFLVTPAMMSILGANLDDIEEILKGLGYRADPKPAVEVKARLEAIDIAARQAVEAAAAAKAAAEQASEADAWDTEKPADAPIETPASDGPDQTIAQSDAISEAPVDVGAPGDQALSSVGDDALSTAAEAIAPVVLDEPVAEDSAVASPETEAPSPADTPPLEAASWAPQVEQLSPESIPAPPDAENAGEAVATGSTSEDAPTAPVEEPKPILVWRLARFEQRPRRQDNRPRSGPRDAVAVPDEGKGRGDRPPRTGDRPPRADARPPRENGGKERFDRSKFRGKPGADGAGPDRRENRGGDVKNGFQKPTFQPKPREERPVRVDPDSPFAKLAALRDQLKK
nr:helicase [Pseudaminobacter sp.]